MDKFPLKEGGGNGLWDRLILIPPYKVALARPTPPIPTLTVEKQVPCRIRCLAMREQTHTFRTLQFSRKISGLVSSGFLAFATEIIKVFSCMNITRCSPLNFINLDLNERHFRNFLLHCAIPYAFPLRLLFKVRTSNMVSGEGEEHILTREKIVRPKKWETERKADFEAKATRRPDRPFLRSLYFVPSEVQDHHHCYKEAEEKRRGRRRRRRALYFTAISS